MPPSQRKQRFARMNRRTVAALKDLDKSQKQASRCYYSPNCTGVTIQAHTISKSWMKPLSRAGKVYWFSNGGVKGMQLQHLKGVPSLVSVKVASAHPFCCAEHDKNFNLIDQPNLHSPSSHQLNLMFYRALLRQLHVDTAASKWLAKYPLGRWVAALFGVQANSRGLKLLQSACSVVQEAISKPQHSERRVRHLSRLVKGHPTLACATAAAWQRHPGGPGAWGVTVIPQATGHLVVYHFCTLVPVGAGIKEDLDKKSSYLCSEIMLADEQALARRVSYDVLCLCEEFCLAPNVWDSYPEKVREDIRRLFSPEFGDPNSSAINFFA